MESNSQEKPKRLDLQGIRGLAILSVLGFHFYPNYFPNGYLGVDQFFVLSGFLMCMLLKRAGNMRLLSLISLFYFKRFKRILPLYLLFIFCSLFALYTVFPGTSIGRNIESASKAIIFKSNRPKTDQENYFQMLSLAFDIFTHTWSLSVEVQFYLIVPFLYVIFEPFSFNYQIIFYAVTGISSFLLYTTSDVNQAFNNVLARTWQFIIGMMVYLYSADTFSKEIYHQKDINDNQRKIVEDPDSSLKIEKSSFVQYSCKLKYVLLFLMISLTFAPLTIPVLFARPLVTIATGLLMSMSLNDYFLSNKFLTYIGDISYSLYLIHWPILSYWKLTMNNSQYLLVVSLLASFLISVIVFETFEKWYIQLSSKRLVFLVILLFLATIFMLNYGDIRKKFDPKHDASLSSVMENMTLDNAARLNYQWSIDDQKNIMSPTCEYQDGSGPLGWCIHKGLDKNNAYNMVIFGNSWTANHANLFYQECGYKANSLIQIARYGCDPLYPYPQSDDCGKNLIDYEKHIADAKPDYAFLLSRFILLGNPFPENVSKMQDDPIYQFMKSQTMKLIRNIKKKLYILNSIPRLQSSELLQIVPHIKANKTFAEIDKGLINLSLYEMARARHDELMKDCGEKCESIDYFNEFYNNSTGTFRYYDENGFSYFTHVDHLSPYGLEKVRHIYRDLCKKI